MALSEGLLKLRWNNHEATFCHILHRLRSKPRYSDATLACEGRLFMVHRLVLATCSDFFDEIFQQTPSDNTRAVIVLNEARAQDVECLLDYMYCGQVNVRQSNLASLLKTAECLKIKGLAVPEAAVTPPSHSKRNQGYTPEQAPAKKKRKKKVEESTGHSTNTNPSPHIVPSTSLSSSPWIPTSMTTTAVSNMQCPSPPTISIPNTSSPLALPLLQASSPTNPITAPLRVTTQVQANEDDKANQKAGWLQIVSSMRQGTASTQLPPESSTPNQQQSNHSSLSNRAQVKMSEGQGEEILEPHLGQLLPIKEELKEEPVSVPLGPDDPLADEENSWGDPEQNHESEGIMYHKVSALHPPPGLHPVTSEGSINHTSVLPLGFLRMAPYAVHSGGQAWENAMPLSQSPEPLSQEASPSASQQAMDLGLDHLISLNKKGSPVHQATMSPKLMPYAMCSNCGTNNTKLWRRNDKGEIVCNACGLYFKLHGINRPSHLFRTAPMTRRRNPKKKKETETMGTEQLEPVISDSSQDKETVPETDPQDGLAVLNAALTLNTLLAKAKAHQAAAREALAAQGVTSPATNKSSSEQSCESRPPPPPLLKIPVMASETDAAPSARTASETARDNSPVELSETEAEMIASPVDPGGTEPQSMQPPPSPPPLDEGRKFIAQLLDK